GSAETRRSLCSNRNALPPAGIERAEIDGQCIGLFDEGCDLLGRRGHGGYCSQRRQTIGDQLLHYRVHQAMHAWGLGPDVLEQLACALRQMLGRDVHRVHGSSTAMSAMAGAASSKPLSATKAPKRS